MTRDATGWADRKRLAGPRVGERGRWLSWDWLYSRYTKWFDISKHIIEDTSTNISLHPPPETPFKL